MTRSRPTALVACARFPVRRLSMVLPVLAALIMMHGFAQNAAADDSDSAVAAIPHHGTAAVTVRTGASVHQSSAGSDGSIGEAADVLAGPPPMPIGMSMGLCLALVATGLALLAALAMSRCHLLTVCPRATRQRVPSPASRGRDRPDLHRLSILLC